MYRLEDNKIIFNDGEIFRHLPLLGSGSQGDVYKFRIGSEIFAIKVFNGLQIENLKNYEQKLNINIDSYISPVRILYINGKFKGYMMKYCRGQNLKQGKLDITIDEFAKSTVKLMDDTYKLGSINYNIHDSYLTNVMYDNGFKMIDIDSYPYVPSKQEKEIHRLNDIRLNLMLKDVFYKNTGLKGTDDEYIKNLMNKCEKGDILFEEVFNILCVRAYNMDDSELNYISEVGKVLRKTKKK